MKSMRTVCYGVAFVACAGIAAVAETNIVIDSFHGNGELVWQGSNMMAYTVQWAPSANGPWTNSWTHLVNIPEYGGSYTASVPMFFRVIGWQGPESVLLMHGDGTNGATDVADQKGHSATAFGDVHISTNESKFGGASLCFDGSGDYLSIPQGSDWAFGTNDFTVDLWLRLTSDVNPIQFIGCHQAFAHDDWAVSRYDGTLGMNLLVGQLRTDITPALNTWYHLAATRAGGILRVFVNGQNRAEQADAGDWGCFYPLTIGRANNEWGYMAGYLDEIRIVKGVAVWTNDFTPPTAPYTR
jgi:hypothetical protein